MTRTIRTSGPGFDCRVCEKDTERIDEVFMVRTDVWQQAVIGRWPLAPGPEGALMLCVGCLERRLDRALTRADFTDFPLNWATGVLSDRLRARLTGPGPLASAMVHRGDGVPEGFVNGPGQPRLGFRSHPTHRVHRLVVDVQPPPGRRTSGTTACRVGLSGETELFDLHRTDTPPGGWCPPCWPTEWTTAAP